jgi:hypothetical protein
VVGEDLLQGLKMQMHTSSSELSAAKLFEIKLCASFGKKTLIFATVQPDEEAAVDFGRAMLDRHHNFDVAEIWHGRKMLRQV